MLTIYHNGACTKSKGALELLIEKNIPHRLRNYLAAPLTKQELRTLWQKLHVPIIEMVRTNEPTYATRFAGKTYTPDEWLDVLQQHPELLQRPIVEKEDNAIIARPVERILELLK